MPFDESHFTEITYGLYAAAEYELVREFLEAHARWVMLARYCELVLVILDDDTQPPDPSWGVT